MATPTATPAANPAADPTTVPTTTFPPSYPFAHLAVFYLFTYSLFFYISFRFALQF